MLVVGLTGGIATGKSTVSKMLRERHSLPIIDADILARDVIAPGTSGFRMVVDHFGADRVLNADGSLNRSAIGEIVFKDQDERNWLNGVVHPRVRRAMVVGILKAWLRGEWCVILDVPLLIEAGLWKWVGEVVVVYINEKLQLSRLLARPPIPPNPPLTEVQAKDRMAAQMPMSAKLNYATSVIDNSGTIADLETQVDRVVARWKQQQGGATGWWWRLCWLLPPVGLVAGWISLLKTYFKAKKVRRRSRGEVEPRRAKPEEHEMQPLRKKSILE